MNMKKKKVIMFLIIGTLVAGSFYGCAAKKESNGSIEKFDSKGESHNNKDIIDEINTQSESK
ncbi:MAG: hypothetical protein ACRCVJ_13520 [Clostridium sp.]|uniref:hypothetical protein n=1 Tax=Clostridium sp. TaxID=1506 RepID=UPI003F2EB0FA